MNMKKVFVMCAALALLSAVSAQGQPQSRTYLEYKGPDGNILQLQGAGDPDPGNYWWYDIPGGSYRAPAQTDYAWVHNGTTTTLSSALSVDRFFVNFKHDTYSTADPATTVYIVNGGSLNLYGTGAVYSARSLRLGKTGTANLYLQEGGSMTNLRRFYVGIESNYGDNFTSTFNMSGGYVRTEQIAIGLSNTTGVVNLSGGRMDVYGSVQIGTGEQGNGRGYLNISGGSLVIPVNDHIWVGLEQSAQGTVNQTGGLVMLGGWGELKIGDVGQGVYRLTGGTVKMGVMGSNMTLGAWRADSSGRLILGQGGTILRGQGGRVMMGPYGTSVELLLGSDADFNWEASGWGAGNTTSIAGDLIATVLEGYAPEMYREWRFMRVFGGGPIEGEFSSVTPGFTYEKRPVYDGGKIFATDLVLIKIPEPATMGLLALGALGMLRRRKAG